MEPDNRKNYASRYNRTLYNDLIEQNVGTQLVSSLKKSFCYGYGTHTRKRSSLNIEISLQQVH